MGDNNKPKGPETGIVKRKGFGGLTVGGKKKTGLAGFGKTGGLKVRKGGTVDKAAAAKLQARADSAGDDLMARAEAGREAMEAKRQLLDEQAIQARIDEIADEMRDQTHLNLLVVVDFTASTGGIIDELKAQAQSIVSRLRAKFASVRIMGVAARGDWSLTPSYSRDHHQLPELIIGDDLDFFDRVRNQSYGGSPMESGLQAAREARFFEYEAPEGVTANAAVLVGDTTYRSFPDYADVYPYLLEHGVTVTAMLEPVGLDMNSYRQNLQGMTGRDGKIVDPRLGDEAYIIPRTSGAGDELDATELITAFVDNKGGNVRRQLAAKKVEEEEKAKAAKLGKQATIKVKAPRISLKATLSKLGLKGQNTAAKVITAGNGRGPKRLTE